MKTGLRTEIVISTVLLLAAALLFAGFLLVKLTERELLEERRISLQRTVRLIATAAPSTPNLSELLLPLMRHGDLTAWRLLDGNLAPLMAESRDHSPLPDDLPAFPLPPGEISETVVYSSSWNPLAAAPANYIDLAVNPVSTDGQMLQLRFSLVSLVTQVRQAQRLVLIYVVLYGGVLGAFGIYLLNRNVVSPIRRLQAATAGVAAGELMPIDTVGRLGEINDLADDFNSMVSALQASRAETAAQIASLEGANRALQQARDEVVRAEKMASVGFLAAGMAHEIGNPLSAVIGYLNLVRDDLADPAQRDLVDRSLLEAGRIDRLVRDLLDYAAPVRTAAEPFDPVEVMREAVALLTGQGVFEKVTVSERARVGLGSVCMDRDRFLQVCVNLLLNARDAMPDGGEVIVDAARQGEEMILTVSDNGQGMAPEVLQRIFEPFFTTKAPGKGRGLGLSVCQRLIAAAGGRIDVMSTAGAGSVFTVCLPGCEEST